MSTSFRNSQLNAANKGYHKASKSINELEQEESVPCHRVSLVKNLPKIEQISPLKSSTIDANKKQYTSLRKKMIEEKKMNPSKITN